MPRTLNDIVKHFTRNLRWLADEAKAVADEWEKCGGCMEYVPNTFEFKNHSEELHDQCKYMIEDLQEIQWLAEDLAEVTDSEDDDTEEHEAKASAVA